jgi:hypothetical protein
MANNLSRDAPKNSSKKFVKKLALATAAELPAVGLVIRAATAGCPAYVGNDGGSPDAPVANAGGAPV